MSESKSASDDDLVLKELLQQAPRKQSSLGNTNLTWEKKIHLFQKKNNNDKKLKPSSTTRLRRRRYQQLVMCDLNVHK